MKKLSKKQKLVGFIAISLGALILAIVITTNITTNNNQSNQIASQEEYLATTANAGSSLISNYILNGITIGGITGKMEVLDTSDATATAEDIALGKTAYVDGEKITGTRIPTSNYDFKDSLGNIVKVPAGFKVVNPEDNVTDGIVIEDVNAGNEDTRGSQFVWIPVGDIITDSDGSKTTITLGRYTFDSTAGENYGKATLVQSAENWEDTSSSVAISTYYKELSTSNYGNRTAKNLEQFISKATTSGGYYIGRYEAGDAKATTSARTSSTSDTNLIVSKTGVYPYTYISQQEASSLCQNMYSSDNFQSDLINSYAWDTAIVFIQEFSGDTNYSRQAGRNTERAVQKCGESILDYNLDKGDVAQDIRCNISGNASEWSTETYSYTGLSVVDRGSRYSDTSNCTSSRYGTDTNYSIYGNVSFRPTLYL